MSQDEFSAGRPDAGPFAALPDHARLWTFGVSRPLSDEEEARLLGVVDRFLDGWKAHGHPLSAARDWRLGRFLVVALDDTVTPPSGCSIDALVRMLRELEDELGIEMVGGAPIWYRDGGPDGPVRRSSRAAFKASAVRGEVTGDTVVFDPAITRLHELREGKWELPARRCWHARLLDRAMERR